MESFNIFTSESQNYQDSYEFNSADLADISCPDDNCANMEDSPAEDDVELPLPPGISKDEFSIPLPPKKEPSQIFSSFMISQNKSFENTSNNLSSTKNFNSSGFDDESLSKLDHKVEEGDVENKATDLFDDNKYSPSKVDSDYENQDFINTKPKVLGKEQAKKRLMAFSLSKQPSSSIKKQKAVTSAKSKEKPPNPNKGSNVQEQFRATISAIEEEKKKMFQNMPSYLLLEMSELTKSHSSMSSSSQILEKLKSESADVKNKKICTKDEITSKEKVRSKRNFCRSKSRSRSPQGSQGSNRKRSDIRNKRSRSRSKRSHSRSRRRSHSKSCGRREREEKVLKSDNKERVPKKKFEDWKEFKAAGSILESDSKLAKNCTNEAKSSRDEFQKRSRSPNEQTDFKPTFNFLAKGSNLRTSLQAKPADLSNSAPIFFSKKIIKYTRTKPILCWSENPNYATEHYMSRQMLLENCDQNTSSILLSIIENKKEIVLDKEDVWETKPAKSRSWYPHERYLFQDSLNTNDYFKTNESQFFKTLENDKERTEEIQTNTIENKNEINNSKEDTGNRTESIDRSICLVNDGYLSDEEHVKELSVRNVESDLKNSVKIRSKWDSDYEGENEKEFILDRKKPKEKMNTQVQAEGVSSESHGKLISDVLFCERKLIDSVENKKTGPLNLVSRTESSSPDVSSTRTGNLVSEYEEFLKMVSVKSNDNLNNVTNEKEKLILESKPKVESRIKTRKFEKSCEESTKINSPKMGMTDWDKESDHEEKPPNKRMEFSESHDEFSIFGKDEKIDINFEKSKKSKKKKSEKVFKNKKKLLKKSSKTKKKKYNESFSEESTTDSYESDSDSESNKSDSSKKKKRKKKLLKNRKSKKDTSSESDSESNGNKIKKKSKKKKGGNKSSSSDDNDDSDGKNKIPDSLLQQLDFKKQVIMNKTEEIDYIDEKNTKKNESGNRKKKNEKECSDETNIEKQIKSGKKKKSESKDDKKKFNSNFKKVRSTGKSKKCRKSTSSSDSDSDSDTDSDSDSDSDSNSESSEESVKGKKLKKLGKKKQDSSDNSDNYEKLTKIKSKSKKTSKKIKQTKKSVSSSESNDSESSTKDKRKSKKKKNKLKIDEKIDGPLGFGQNLFDESNIKNESSWNNTKLWKKTEKREKKKKEDDDWEASSPGEESGEERKTGESCWNEDMSISESITHKIESNSSKSNKQSHIIVPEKDVTDNNSTNVCETNNQLASEALKTSLSNFSFNENSFCSFGQELSRDFFLTERSYTNSGVAFSNDNLKTTLIEPRPFQSVNKDSEVKKPNDSELYSPGCSDSELSEAEMCKSVKASCDDENRMREDIYDPLNCDSEGSAENNEIELSSIPLPRVSDILLPGESRNVENITNPLNSEGNFLKEFAHKENEFSANQLPVLSSPSQSCFTVTDFTPIRASQSSLSDEKNAPSKRQLMSVKGQQKLISKAASVFQDDSDEENIEPSRKEKTIENPLTQTSLDSKEKTSNENQRQTGGNNYSFEEKDEIKRRRKESRDKSVEKENRRRSRSRERKGSDKTYSKKPSSPNKKRKSRTPESKREKRIIRSDSFEIEPLKSAIDPSQLSHLEQPIPVLTGLDASSEGLWNISLASGNGFTSRNANLIDHAESFDIYPSEESTFRNKSHDKDYISHERVPVEKLKDGKYKKDRRKSRSRSYSPKKRLRSKSPERRKEWKESPKNRSPRRKSLSPKRKDRSPFSPRRRSPKRKSPSRGYKNSRSPDKRRKSPSRSPKRRRTSSSRRSRSVSPRKYRSPKHRDESPRRKDSPARGFSPDNHFSVPADVGYSQSYSVGLQNRIPVIGATNDGVDMKLSPSALCSSYENSMGFSRHIPHSSVVESEMYSSFYEGDYIDEFGVSAYPEEVGVNNLITVKNHDIEKITSPERLSLDQRIELELGVPVSGPQSQGDQYPIPSQVCPPFQEINQSPYQNSYTCDNTSVSNDSFYPNQNAQMNSEFNGQYFNDHQSQAPPSYGSFQQYPSQSVQNSVLQVGNIVEVVPTLQHPPPVSSLRPKAPQIMQVGNVLQVVPSQKATPSISQTVSHNYGPSDDSPMIKTQKATAVVAPSSIVPTPNPEVLLNPLIKAIQLEREKRKKEKEKRKAEREARRKARQLRREAKLLSVNEKLKKSVQNEGLMLGQEVEDDELLDGLDVPSPPVPVEIITISSPSALPPAGKGILITAGFMPKPPSEKKEVKFADGVCPGEGTSTSGGEDVASPPPKPKLPKEKRFKKKKTKVKKKVKVQIIRQIIQEEDDDEDDLSPPPPPPGDPPPVFFARFPFANDAQFPVYHSQTTTTTLTTVQYPAH